MEELPIRIRRKQMRHLRDDLHYGDAEFLGYRDPWHLLNDVAQNWTDRYVNPENGRVVLVRRREGNAVAVVELAKAVDGDYWDVRTAGRRSDDQLKELVHLGARARPPESATGD